MATKKGHLADCEYRTIQKIASEIGEPVPVVARNDLVSVSVRLLSLRQQATSSSAMLV
jgi:hypothetical protein